MLFLFTRLLSLFTRFPVYGASIAFLSVAMPINYLFLSDKPDNVLEKAEEFVIKQMTGIDVDLSKYDNPPKKGD